MASKKADSLATISAFIAASPADKNVYFGIDPGLTGAVGMLCGRAYCVVDIPTSTIDRVRRVKVRRKDGDPPGPKTRTVKGKAGRFDMLGIKTMFDALRPLDGRVHVMLEIATPSAGRKFGGKMVGNDARTAFLTGCGYMMWPLFLMEKGYFLEQVEPEDWQKDFGLIGKDKEVARLKAAGYWPAAPLTAKSHHNRADALLLAECLRRRHGQERSAPARK